MATECDLTVIVACVEASCCIDRALSALHDACAGLSVQIIVVDASTDGTTRVVRRLHPDVELFEYPPGTLVPRLWAAGLDAAKGRVVAFTIGQVAVVPTWADAMVRNVDDKTATGGPLILASQTGVFDWAVFYLRYSAMLPSQLRDGPIAGEIAGDNAAYSKVTLERHKSSMRDGFWEVEFHRLMRVDGGQLNATAQATARFMCALPFRHMARHRYLHGQHFGASRIAHGAHAMLLVVKAPLVPLVLAGRVARRALPESEHRWRFLAALPWFLTLATIWALGEAHGALAGRPVLPRDSQADDPMP